MMDFLPFLLMLALVVTSIAYWEWRDRRRTREPWRFGPKSRRPRLPAPLWTVQAVVVAGEEGLGGTLACVGTQPAPQDFFALEGLRVPPGYRGDVPSLRVNQRGNIRDDATWRSVSFKPAPEGNGVYLRAGEAPCWILLGDRIEMTPPDATLLGNLETEEDHAA